MRAGDETASHYVAAGSVLDYGDRGTVAVTPDGVVAELYDTTAMRVGYKDRDRHNFPDGDGRGIEHHWRDGTPRSGDYERYDLAGYGNLTAFVDGRLKVVVYKVGAAGVAREPLAAGAGHTVRHTTTELDGDTILA